MKNQIDIPVEWGDSDPATIVFYPNFFKWFDIGTWRLFEAAGLSYDVLTSEYGLCGMPLVEATAKFSSPIRYGDTVRLTSHVSVWSRKTFEVTHRAEVGGQLRARGSETRVLARQPAGPGTIEAVAPPGRIVAALPVHEPPG
jgi:4-hydroxybenzoyl-CoA thioesterase